MLGEGETMSWLEDDIISWSSGSTRETPSHKPWQTEKQVKYTERLDRCNNFREVFQLVKRSVKETLGLERAGLMLFLADMPYVVGAYHQVGTNNIVMNRALLNHVLETSQSMREANSFIYSILTHEYLHALGRIDEREARELAYRISKETFGEDHLATRMAASSPWQFLRPPSFEIVGPPGLPSVVRDFEPPPFGYIS